MALVRRYGEERNEGKRRKSERASRRTRTAVYDAETGPCNEHCNEHCGELIRMLLRGACVRTPLVCTRAASSSGCCFASVSAKSRSCSSVCVLPRARTSLRSGCEVSRNLVARAQPPSGEGLGDAEEIGSGKVSRTIPVFPLGVVPVPFAEVPLHIFEARYRVLFSTLLYGEDDIEEGLADASSEFAGSKEFGMCYVDKEGNIASVGSLLEIEKHQLLEDGRIFVQNKAVKRFTVSEVIEQNPILLCKVDFIEDDLEVDESGEVQELAKEVVELFQKSLALGSNLENKQEPPKPEQLTSLPPTELSYWLASLFPQDPQEQQLLLQIESAEGRLERLKEIFEATYNYHLARNSIKSAFGEGGEGGEE